MEPQGRRDRLIALSLLGALLFSPPLLAIFARPGLIGGAVMLFVYPYLAWAGVIGLAAWIVTRPKSDPD
jgi:hypothetical protein